MPICEVIRVSVVLKESGSGGELRVPWLLRLSERGWALGGGTGQGHRRLCARHRIMPFLAPEHCRIWGFFRLLGYELLITKSPRK